jgi:hypothetical protein
VPHEPCVACLKGDTDTFLPVRGTAEWIAAALHVYADIPRREARAMAEDQAAMTEPIDGDEYQNLVRLCRECAAKTNVTVTRPGELCPVIHERATGK